MVEVGPKVEKILDSLSTNHAWWEVLQSILVPPVQTQPESGRDGLVRSALGEAWRAST